MSTHRVRWDTAHEEADIKKLFEAVGDDFAIALDRAGWQIVMKPYCRHEFDCEENLWAMYQESTAAPDWATEINAVGPVRQIAYRPFPGAHFTLFGVRYDDDD